MAARTTMNDFRGGDPALGARARIQRQCRSMRRWGKINIGGRVSLAAFDFGLSKVLAHRVADESRPLHQGYGMTHPKQLREMDLGMYDILSNTIFNDIIHVKILHCSLEQSIEQGKAVRPLCVLTC